MATSYNKREQEKKKEQKRQEKLKRKEERKATAGSGSLDDMIAYVDENGQICSAPPEPGKKQEIDLEDIAVSTPKKEEMEEVPLQGRVTFFNPDKGFGFIETQFGRERYFFHISNTEGNIAEGNTVTFDLERGDRGMNAVNIVLVK